MDLITAQAARDMLVSRESLIAKCIAEWTEEFNKQVESASKGTDKTPGVSYLFFHISATTEAKMSAKGMFISRVQAAGFDARLHDSNDDNDHFVYRIDWSEAGK